MQAIYQANIEGLDDYFLSGLKKLFRGKQVKLIVSEINDEVWNKENSKIFSKFILICN